MTLTGWQAVALVVIAAALALAGAVLGTAAGTGLVGLSGTIVGGVFALLQMRSPQSRTRAGDRRDTAAGGNPITPPPETFPPPRR